MKNKILQQLIDFIDEAPTLNRSILKEKIYELDKAENAVFETQCMLIVDEFHNTCTELPRIKELTNPRKSAIKARIKKYSYETIIAVFYAVSQSDFLSGRKTDFKASFDWILKPTNFQKIIEGNYVNKEPIIQNAIHTQPLIGRANMETVVKNAQFTPINLGNNE